MPLAPPVTMAVRPASLAMRSGLCVEAPYELVETRELLLDQIDRRCVLELERLLVEFLRGKGHDNLGPAEQNGIDRGQRLAQMILRA